MVKVMEGAAVDPSTYEFDVRYGNWVKVIGDAAQNHALRLVNPAGSGVVAVLHMLRVESNGAAHGIVNLGLNEPAVVPGVIQQNRGGTRFTVGKVPTTIRHLRAGGFCRMYAWLGNPGSGTLLEEFFMRQSLSAIGGTGTITHPAGGGPYPAQVVDPVALSLTFENELQEPREYDLTGFVLGEDSHFDAWLEDTQAFETYWHMRWSEVPLGR
jgi:hypothetical protein